MPIADMLHVIDHSFGRTRCAGDFALVGPGALPADARIHNPHSIAGKMLQNLAHFDAFLHTLKFAFEAVEIGILNDELFPDGTSTHESRQIDLQKIFTDD